MLRRGTVLAAFAALGVAAPQAAAGPVCSASALRVGVNDPLFEPAVANPRFAPCADAVAEEVRTNASLLAGAVAVNGSTIGARTQDAHAIPGFDVLAAADSAVQRVTITAGPATITAWGVQSSASLQCDVRFECTASPSLNSSIAVLEINGVQVPVGAGLAIPIPGVGTLHVNSVGFDRGLCGLFTMHAALYARALWLEGFPPFGDVVVAESRVFWQPACF